MKLLDDGEKAFLSGDDMIGWSGNPTEWRPEAFRFRRWTDVVALSNFFRHFRLRTTLWSNWKLKNNNTNSS